MRRSVLYVGQYHLPRETAGASRVLGVGQSLRAAGYRVGLIASRSREEGCHAEPALAEIDWRAPDLQVPRRRFRKGNLSRLIWVVAETARAMFGAARESLAAVVVYGDHCTYVPWLLPMVRWLHVPLIVDVVEWPEPRHRTGGWLAPVSWTYEFGLRILNRWANGVIAISRFLERFYAEKGLAVIRIPPTVDCRRFAWRTEKERTPGPLRIAYAGNPGQKDLLAVVFAGVAAAMRNGVEVELHVAGLDRQGVVRVLGDNCALIEELGENLKLYGRLAQPDAVSLVRNCDFSAFLRPDARVSNAGFPTKAVESMAAGTPLLCNLTSDLGEYVRDGDEGVLAADDSSVAFHAALRRAAGISETDRARMRRLARSTAERAFDFRSYSNVLGEFIEEVRTRLLRTETRQ